MADGSIHNEELFFSTTEFEHKRSAGMKHYINAIGNTKARQMLTICAVLAQVWRGYFLCRNSAVSIITSWYTCHKKTVLACTEHRAKRRQCIQVVGCDY